MLDRITDWSVLGPVALAASIGVQLTVLILIVYGPTDGRAQAQYTRLGKAYLRPEREVPLYALGLILSLAIIWVIAVAWQRAVRRYDGPPRRHFAISSSIYLLFLGAFSLFLFILIINFRLLWMKFAPLQDIPVAALIGGLLPSIAAIICCWAHLRPARFKKLSPVQKTILDVGIAAVLFCLVFVPPNLWNALAGNCFAYDHLHHWNFFIMSPALAYLHGGAFETDFYSQYGIGWPFLFATFHNVVSLTYGHLLGVSVLYGCIYFLVLYWFLRQLIGDQTWAFAGVILAITWQLYTGREVGGSIWQTPSSTLLRHPLDVFFFLILLLHQRYSNIMCLAAAGVLCALGLFLETDTGVYLFITFAFYYAIDTAARFKSRHTVAKAAGNLLFFLSAAVITLVPLLWVASRGTVLHRAFWIESLAGAFLHLGSGVGMMPIRELNIAQIGFFIAFLMVYLSTIGIACGLAIFQRASAEIIILASISVHGLGLLLIFVGRSDPFNLYHPAIPLAIILIVGMAYVFRLARPVLGDTAFPVVFSLMLLVLLVSSREFTSEPTLASWPLRKPMPLGICLIKDPPDLAGPATEFFNAEALRAVSGELRRLAADGSTIVVVDLDDTLLYYASGVRPPLRTSSLFRTLFTKPEVESAWEDIANTHPQFVVIRNHMDLKNPDSSTCEDSWQRFRYLIEQNNHKLETVGDFEVWQPRGNAQN